MYNLLKSRYSAMKEIFPSPSKEMAVSLCEDGDGRIPIVLHLLEDLNMEVAVFAQKWHTLPHIVRDITFTNFIEEITAQVG